MAVRTDGSGDYIGRTTSLPDPTAVTMSGWAIMDVDRANFSSVCCLTASLRTNGQLCLQTAADGNTFNLWYDSGSIGVQEPSTGYAASVGVPFFWALTSNGTGGSGVTAYFREYGSRDFNVVFSGTTGLGATYTPVLMRFGNADTTEFWNGRIQNVKVWDRALSRAELLVESYYKRVEFPANIHLYYPLEQGVDLTDYSGQGRNGTAVGTLTDGDSIGLWTPRKKIFLPQAATGVIGDATITLGALTVSSAGTLSINGTATPTLGALTSSSAGTLAINGAASITLGALTTSSAGSLAINGALSTTLGALTLSSEGVVSDTRTGAADITLGALTTSSAGSLAINGAVSTTLGALTVDSFGAHTILGDLGVTLGALTVSATGTGPVVDTEDSIDGQASYTINAAYGSITIYHRGDRRFFTL